jgi:hypothetical protein
MKRNSSMGSIMEGLWLGLTPLTMKPNILSPQAGVSNELTTLTLAASDSNNLTMKNDARAPTFSFAPDGDSEMEYEDAIISTCSGGTSIEGNLTPDPPSSPIQTLKNFFGRPH